MITIKNLYLNKCKNKNLISFCYINKMGVGVGVLEHSELVFFFLLPDVRLRPNRLEHGGFWRNSSQVGCKGPTGLPACHKPANRNPSKQASSRPSRREKGNGRSWRVLTCIMGLIKHFGEKDAF